MKVAIYARVSQDSQTVENQLQELQAVAQRQGWEVVATFIDEGISGATGRDKRPGFDKLLKGVARKDFEMIAAWSVDRLGRSLAHLVGFLGDIQTKGVDLYLHQQGPRHLDQCGPGDVRDAGGVRRTGTQLDPRAHHGGPTSHLEAIWPPTDAAEPGADDQEIVAGRIEHQGHGPAAPSLAHDGDEDRPADGAAGADCCVRDWKAVLYILMAVAGAAAAVLLATR